MSDYDFMLDNMHFSFSSVSTFETCAYSFYLTYIDIKERSSNYFSDYGLFIHNILEKYFKGELEIFELSNYYQEHYSENIVHAPPPFPVGMPEKYFSDGLEFFENFEFNKNEFEILLTEAKVGSSFDNHKIVVKPDLILKEKKTGKIYLYDYKTSVIHKNGKTDKKKLIGYKNQMNLYSYFVEKELGIKIDDIKLWFVRTNTFEEFEYSKEDALLVVKEVFSDNIDKILNENEFKANTSNDYFCNQLCSVKEFCEFRNKID